MSNIVIYLFSDENGLPKYVGKSKNLKDRINQHLNRDRFKYKTYFYNWLNKTIREDKNYFIDILEECSEDNHREREKYWIKHIKENNYKLTNMTDGGDGNNNQIFSKESGIKRGQKLRGRKHSEESKRKMSEKIKETRIKKRVFKKDLNGIILEEFDSLKEASLCIGCRTGTLSNIILNKKTPIFKNFLWSY